MKRLYTPLLCLALFTLPFHAKASSEDSHMSHLGVSAEFIRNFMKQVEDKTLDEHGVNERYIKPATLEKNCPYVELYEDERGQDGCPSVQPATIFVSHAWKYPMQMTLQAVLDHAEETGGNHYYWIDIFTVNQHVKVMNNSFWDEGFRNAIGRAEATLLVLSPWNDPIPLKRVWCLWEIAGTVLAKKEVVVQMPRPEKEGFREAIVKDFESVFKAMMTVDFQKAGATKEEDKLRIFKAIEDDPNLGFYTLNETVKEQMRQWMAGSGMELADRGADSQEKAELLHSLAGMYLSLGDFDKTERLSSRGLEIAAKVDRNSSLTGSFLNVLGNAYSNKGNYDRAISYYEQALKIKKRVLGEIHPDTAAILNNLGTAYKDKGEYDQAIEYHAIALEIRKHALGDNHPRTASNYNSLGEAYHAKGEYDKAIEYFESALEIHKHVLGETHPETAGSLNNLGGVYHAKGEYDRAIRYFGKALEIRKHVLGETHPATAGSLNNLGSAYYFKGEYDRAIEYLGKALEIKKQVGEKHPDTAGSYTNLGCAYDSKGEYDRAIESHKKALEIQMHVLGQIHPSIATSYSNLGNAYDSMSEYDKAIEYHGKALEIRIQIFGETHPDTAASYNNLGVAYESKGEYDRAIEYYKKAGSIFTRTLGKRHPYTRMAYSSLDRIRVSQHDKARGSAPSEPAASVLGEALLDTASNYSNLGNAYHANGEYGRAIECHEKALEIRKRILGESHLDTGLSYNNLGVAHAFKGDYDQAIAYCEKASSIFTDILGQDHPHTLKVNTFLCTIRACAIAKLYFASQ